MTDLASRVDGLTSAWQSPPGLVGFVSGVNHKQIGRRFIVTAFAFLLIGGLEAMLIRAQLARPESGVLDAETYNQIFTMHGTTMMFLFAVPMIEGLAIYFVPLMIGTRDMPFPRLNAFGYWAFLFGGVLLNWSFVTGSVPDGGWYAYTPLTGPEYSPTTALDYWLLGVTFVEIAGVVGALELVVLILRQRAPGMSLVRMPLFVWSILVTAAMMLIAFPAVIAASLLLELERKFGLPFYAPEAGGNPLLWQHLFWIFGHPEVYIMLLPATGIVSAVIAVHARRAIVAYELVVAALVSIGVISFGLWVHHMFVVGLPTLAQMLFVVASATIAVPSGIQVFAWLATIAGGRPRWNTPMLYVLGFVVTFVAGGITGVMVAAAPFDWQAHDTFFVVAHFHYVLVGGVVFPIFAGLHHWFPKLTGRVPGERAGRLSFLLTFVGFHVAFFPQHILGLRGMPRRVYTYSDDLGWGGYNTVSTIGSYLLGLGVLVFTLNLLHAWRQRSPAGDDPWDGDSLEWSTSSQPAPYNFRELPTVGGRSPRWEPRPTPDVRTAGVLARLADSDGGRREQLHTTAIEASYTTTFTLPGPSPWPLVAAIGIATSLVGLLADNVVVASIGVLILIVGLARWAEPPGGWSAASPSAQVVASPERPAGWHGLLFGLVAVAGVVGALVYAYYFLRATSGQWPPGTIGAPAILLPTLGVLAAVAAAVAVHAAGRRGATRPATLFGGLVLGVVALTADVIDLAALPFAGGDNAYAAAFVTLRGYRLLAVGIGLAVAVLALRAAIRRPGDTWTAGVARITRLLWWFVAGSSLVVWCVLQLTPRAAERDTDDEPRAPVHHGATSWTGDVTMDEVTGP